MKNVKQEQLHTQTLVDAKSKDVDTETHLRQLAGFENTRKEYASVVVVVAAFCVASWCFFFACRSTVCA